MSQLTYLDDGETQDGGNRYIVNIRGLAREPPVDLPDDLDLVLNEGPLEAS